jgi:hypothetical protein
MKEEKVGFNPDTKEYKLSTTVAGLLRQRTNQALGDVLTLIEVSLGDTAQAEALKKMVKQTLWNLTDDNQHAVYYAFGQEPYQLGDPFYIKEVLQGTDGQSNIEIPASEYQEAPRHE